MAWCTMNKAIQTLIVHAHTCVLLNVLWVFMIFLPEIIYIGRKGLFIFCIHCSYRNSLLPSFSQINEYNIFPQHKNVHYLLMIKSLVVIRSHVS